MEGSGPGGGGGRCKEGGRERREGIWEEGFGKGESGGREGLSVR